MLEVTPQAPQMEPRYTRKPEQGQGLVEYALILSLVALAVMAVVTVFGGALANTYARIEASLSCSLNQNCVTAGEDETTERIAAEYIRCIGGQLQVSFMTSYGANTVITVGSTTLTYDRGVNRHRGTLSGGCPAPGTPVTLPFNSQHTTDAYGTSGSITIYAG